MSIDIEEVIESVKWDIHHFDRIKDTDSRKMLKVLEQQQSLLNKIKVDLMYRADLKGAICVDLSDGVWMELCELTASPQDKKPQK